MYRRLRIEAAERQNRVGRFGPMDEAHVVPGNAQRHSDAGVAPRHRQLPASVRKRTESRPPPRRPLAIMITAVVRTTIARLSTAIAPTSPLSFRSKIRTATTLVSEINKITARSEERRVGK